MKLSFSYYQNFKNLQISSRKYSRGDIVAEQEKLNKILQNTNEELKEKKEIMIKRINKNIQFLCSMMNQEILEKCYKNN